MGPYGRRHADRGRQALRGSSRRANSSPEASRPEDRERRPTPAQARVSREDSWRHGDASWRGREDFDERGQSIRLHPSESKWYDSDGWYDREDSRPRKRPANGDRNGWGADGRDWRADSRSRQDRHKSWPDARRRRGDSRPNSSDKWWAEGERPPGRRASRPARSWRSGSASRSRSRSATVPKDGYGYGYGHSRNKGLRAPAPAEVQTAPKAANGQKQKRTVPRPKKRLKKSAKSAPGPGAGVAAGPKGGEEHVVEDGELPTLQHDPYQLLDPTDPILPPKVLVPENEQTQPNGRELPEERSRLSTHTAYFDRSRSRSCSCYSSYSMYSYNSYSYGCSSRSWSPRPVFPDTVQPPRRSESRGREAPPTIREAAPPLEAPPGSWAPREEASSLQGGATSSHSQGPGTSPFTAGGPARPAAPGWDYRPPPGQFPPPHLPAHTQAPPFYGMYPPAQYQQHAGYPPPGYGPPPSYGRDIGYGKMEGRPRSGGRDRLRGRRRGADGRRGRSRSPGRGARAKKRRKNRKPKSPGEPPPKWGETWEEPRESNGLKLISEAAPKSLPWRLVLNDESRRCFAAFMPSPVPQQRLQAFFRTIRDGTTWLQPDGPQGLMPRKTAWMVRPGCTCPYRYGGVLVEPQVFPSWMSDVLRTYMPYCGFQREEDWPDSCNVNLYEDGSNSVGWHSDDEALFQGLLQDTRIISLSLGQQRKFDLRKNWPEAGEKIQDRLHLGNGALATMEGMLQKHYMHRVPREADDLGPRINLTWRWIKKHSQDCPKATGP